MDDTPRRPSGVRFDGVGIALMVAALAIGLVNRAILPEPGECAQIHPVSPFLLSASVIAFGFGFVRCLTGRAAGIGRAIMIAVAVALVLLALAAGGLIDPVDCG